MKAEEDHLALIKEWNADRLLEDNVNAPVPYDKIKAETVESQERATGAKELFNSDNIDLKSELNPKEIVAASRLLFMSERRGMPGFEHFVTNLLRLKVSNARKGRREYIEGLHAEEKKEQGRDMSPILELFRNNDR
jgi:hypothetical protein